VTILSQTGRILFCPLLGAMPDSGRALMYQNPLIINLIIPLAFRSAVAFGKNALDS
jgi:hypothetical protein